MRQEGSTPFSTAPLGDNYKLFFGTMVTITAGLFSFIAVVSAGPYFSNGEAWLVWAYRWWFSMPAILIVGLISPFAVAWWRRPMSWIHWALAFVAHALLVALIGVGTTLMLLQLLPKTR